MNERNLTTTEVRYRLQRKGSGKLYETDVVCGGGVGRDGDVCESRDVCRVSSPAVRPETTGSVLV